MEKLEVCCRNLEASSRDPNERLEALSKLQAEMAVSCPQANTDPSALEGKVVSTMCRAYLLLGNEHLGIWSSTRRAGSPTNRAKTGAVPQQRDDNLEEKGVKQQQPGTLDAALLALNKAVMFGQTGRSLAAAQRESHATSLAPCRCMLARARAFLLTRCYYELAALDYLYVLHAVTQRTTPDARTETVDKLRFELCFNTALSYRLCGSISKTEGVIYAAYSISPLATVGDPTATATALAKLPHRLRVVLEICRLVRSISHTQDLLACTMMLGSACADSVAKPESMANMLGLVQLCTQYFLSVRLLNTINARKGTTGGISPDEEAALAEGVCDEFVHAATGGQVEHVRVCLTDGLPPQVHGASKLVRHAFVTVMDFCTSYSTLATWASIKDELAFNQDLAGESGPTWSATAFPVLPPMCALEDIDTFLVPAMLTEFECDETHVFSVELEDSFGILPAPATSARESASHSPTGREEGEGERTGSESSFVDVAPTTGAQWKDMNKAFVPFVSGLTEHDPALSDLQRSALHQFLPIAVQQSDWFCNYSTTEHGVSLNTLLANTLDLEPVLLVVTSNDHTFGAYIPSALKVTTRFYGRGETMVFTTPNIPPADPEAIKSHDPKVVTGLTVHRWSERNEYFTLIKHGAGLSVGGGATGSAILLHQDLFTGNSYPCATFSSPPLTPTDEGTGFDVYRVDVYTFLPIDR